jgi:hypothetical protein
MRSRQNSGQRDSRSQAIHPTQRPVGVRPVPPHAMLHGQALVDLPAVFSLIHGFPSEQNKDSKVPNSHGEFNWRPLPPELRIEV